MFRGDGNNDAGLAGSDLAQPVPDRYVVKRPLGSQVLAQVQHLFFGHRIVSFVFLYNKTLQISLTVF